MKYMVDTETLGKRPGCPILSIGVVAFSGAKFYQKISLESCIESGLVSEKETIDWWLTQPKEIYEEAMSGTKSLSAVLYELVQWLSDHGEIEEIWANGSDFDFPILVTAFHKIGLEVPWKYSDVRDYRTLRKMFPFVKPPVENTKKHSAIADAEYQLFHLLEILRCLSKS